MVLPSSLGIGSGLVCGFVAAILPEISLGFRHCVTEIYLWHDRDIDLLVGVPSHSFVMDRIVHDGTFPRGEVVEVDETYTDNKLIF